MSKTQTFNDGIVRIYEKQNIAQSGNMPVMRLSLKCTLRYKERTVGYHRYYTALQGQAQIDYLLRCRRRRDVSTQDIAVPNDGQQYRIVQVQHPEDVTPPVMDLTLEKVQEVFSIAEGADGTG